MKTTALRVRRMGYPIVCPSIVLSLVVMMMTISRTAYHVEAFCSPTSSQQDMRMQQRQQRQPQYSTMDSYLRMNRMDGPSSHCSTNPAVDSSEYSSAAAGPSMDGIPTGYLPHVLLTTTATTITSSAAAQASEMTSLYDTNTQAMAESLQTSEAVDASISSSGIMGIAIDLEALQQKNKARQKFGLKPLSVEEFALLQSEVQQLDAERRTILAHATAEKQQQQQAQAEKQGGPNFLEHMFGTVLRSTCESNSDCERPEVCCDLGFKKMCCRSGTFVKNHNHGLQYALVPVPVSVQDDR